MNWYYVDNGQQAGPVDDAQLEALRASGKVQPDTLIWTEGMANWQAYAQVRGSAPAAPVAAVAPPLVVTPTALQPGEALCAECGRVFPQSEVIRYGDKSICASCKPVFFQRVREGAAFMPGPGGASEADVLARDYEVEIGGSFSRGWEVFKNNLGILLAGTVLVVICILVSKLIPYLSIILSLLLPGPLMGGLWYLYLKGVRNQQPELGDAFSGFSKRFWHLVLANIVPGLLAGLVFLFGVILAAVMLPGLIAVGRRSPGFGSGAHYGVMLVPVGILMLLGFGVMMYLSTCWFFVLPLVRDKGYTFWPAMGLSRRVVMKHWWMNFWLMLVMGLFAGVGVLGCGAGFFFTAPIAFGALASHYEKLFGDLAPIQN